jgi:hypothetical protein
MPQKSESEFKRLLPRAHQLLTGVPLRDGWAVDMQPALVPYIGTETEACYAAQVPCRNRRTAGTYEC